MQLRRCFFFLLMSLLLLILLLRTITATDVKTTTISKQSGDNYSEPKTRRYLLYEVNMGEGFNLRRDVHMRMANLVRHLIAKGHNFVLVLPPLGGIYHWQSRKIEQQVRLPWHLFFDIPSLDRFVPVIEFEDFLKETGSNTIDHVYYLQHYAEGWAGGKWEEKWDYRPCIEARYYEFSQAEAGMIKGWFFGYDNQITATKLDCISVQGESKTLIPLILAENNTARSIMIDRAETVLHDWFGDKYFWQARRSMRYAKPLVEIGNKFREEHLDSVDDMDQTLMTEDWREMSPPHGTAKGGPFIGMHWRRRDFLRSHSAEVPSVDGTVKQLVRLSKKYRVERVFIATDTTDKNELEKLEADLKKAGIILVRYVPPLSVLEKYKEGGVSIIEQWICAHARVFIGTHVSTFSFRIQEDREILGFDPETTFNRFCPDGHLDDCEQPAKWKIAYD